MEKISKALVHAPGSCGLFSNRGPNWTAEYRKSSSPRKPDDTFGRWMVATVTGHRSKTMAAKNAQNMGSDGHGAPGAGIFPVALNRYSMPNSVKERARTRRPILVELSISSFSWRMRVAIPV